MKSSISISLLLALFFFTSVHCAPSKLSKLEKEDKDSKELPKVSADKAAIPKDVEKDGNPPNDLSFTGIPEVDGLVDGMAPGLGGRIHSILNPILRRSKIHFLSLTEDLLERSTEMVDHVGELVDKMRNQTKFRTETKQKLRYMKKKARHLREDIEDQIEIEKERAAKAEAEEEKRKAQESIHLLAAAKQKLKAVVKGRFRRHFTKRNTWNLDYSKQEELPWIIDLPQRRLNKRSMEQLPWIIDLPQRRVNKRSIPDSLPSRRVYREVEDDGDIENDENDNEEKYSEEKTIEVQPKRHQKRNLIEIQME